MIEIGYHCSHEQFPPDVLLQHARRAEAAGFAHAMCSDHLQPWSVRQGHSGFAWSWLGAAVTQTRLTFGTVNAPGQRYHPVVVAHAAATLALLAPGRVWVSLGSGENVNEHVTGDPWPPKERRQQRLRECADVMRRLWAGEHVDHDGEVVVRRARLWSRPSTPPAIVGAALSEETAGFVGGWADAMITATSDPGTLRPLVSAFREGGGAGKPVYVQSALAFARSEEEGLRAVHDQWRHAALPPSDWADVEEPEEFDRRSADVSVADMRGKLPVFTGAAPLVEHVRALAEAGADRVYLHDVSRDVERFLGVLGEGVLPRLRA